MSTEQKDITNLPVRSSLSLLYTTSLVIAAIMAISSIAGLPYQNIVYPTKELVQSFLANDVVNLLIGVPILLGSMWLARRDKLAGLLLWPGALFYVLYTYVVYVFAMPVSVAFLFYLALVTMSAYTLIGLVASIDGKAVHDQLTEAVPVRSGGGVLAVLGLLIFVRVVVVMVTGVVNQTSFTGTELALNVSDFVLAPAWVIGGVLLWKRRALGYVTGLGLLFQASMLFVGLIAIMIIQPVITAEEFALGDVLVVLVMGMVSFIPFGLFVRGVASNRKSLGRNDQSHE